MSNTITPERAAELLAYDTDDTASRIWDSPEFRDYCAEAYANHDRLGRYSTAELRTRPNYQRFIERLRAAAGRPTERTDLDGLWAALGKEANDRGWCSEYDAFAAQHGGPARPERMTRRAVRIAMPVYIEVPQSIQYDDDAVNRYWRELGYTEQRRQIEAKLDELKGFESGVSPDHFFLDPHEVAS